MLASDLSFAIEGFRYAHDYYTRYSKSMPPIGRDVRTQTSLPELPEISATEGSLSTYKEILRKHHYKDDVPPQYCVFTDAGVAKSITRDPGPAFITYSTQSSTGRFLTNMAGFSSSPVDGLRTLQSWPISDFVDVNAIYNTLSLSGIGEFCVDHSQTLIRIANSTNEIQYMTLYDLAVKRDILRDSSGLTTDQYFLGAQNPLGAAQKSLFELTSKYDTVATPGVNFNEAVLFKDNYKIVKTHKLVMRPGQVHEHKVFIEHHKHFNYTYMTNHMGYKGFTHWVVAVAEGQPAYNGVSNKYGFAAGSLTWTFSSKYKYHTVLPATRTLAVVNAANQDRLQPISNLQAIEPETGAVAVETSAS